MYGFSFLKNMLTNGENSDRSGAINDTVKGIVIDTCFCFDTKKWETGIQKPNEKWVVVEEYEDSDKASKGHEKWVKIINENPSVKLVQCRTPEEWFFGGAI